MLASPKSFTWKRRIDSDGTMTQGLSIIQSSDMVNITNRNLRLPVSTSVLRVTETTAGMWRYRCKVALVELRNVSNKVDVYPIHITGKPLQLFMLRL